MSAAVRRVLPPCARPVVQGGNVTSQTYMSGSSRDLEHTYVRKCWFPKCVKLRTSTSVPQSAVKAQLAKLGSAAVSQLPLSKIGEGSAPIAAGGRDEGEADSKRLSEKVRFATGPSPRSIMRSVCGQVPIVGTCGLCPGLLRSVPSSCQDDRETAKRHLQQTSANPPLAAR